MPVEGDMTSYHWTLADGRKDSLEMPPFAIFDTDSVSTTLKQYVDHHIFSYLDNHLDNGDVLLWEPFQMALRGKVSQW